MNVNLKNTKINYLNNQALPPSMKTELLYMKDPYLKEFGATVISANGKFIKLDKTALYPQGGGQPFDEGTLTRDGEEFKVVFGGWFDGDVSYEIDKEGLKEGDKVKGKIDWERRYRLMRIHTAAHVLAAVIDREESVKITGGNLSLEKGRLDFSMEEFNKEKIEKYIEMCNQEIEKDLPVKLHFLSKEEAMKNPDFFRLAKGFDKDVEEVRLVEIETLDKQADGGTHVNSLKEIGKMELIKANNKGKNNRRVYYTVKP